jgi:hypothetical protein
VHGLEVGLGISQDISQDLPPLLPVAEECARGTHRCSGRNQARATAPPNAKTVAIDTPLGPCVCPLRFAHAGHGPDAQGSLDRPASETREPPAPRWIPGPRCRFRTAAASPPRPGCLGERRKAAQLPTDIDPRRMRPPYRQLRTGSPRSLGLLAPVMPMGSRFARYSDACLVGALCCGGMPERPGCFRPAVCYTRGSSQAHPDDAFVNGCHNPEPRSPTGSCRTISLSVFSLPPRLPVVQLSSPRALDLLLP